jgi:CheY-like chemotaxis protein
VTGRPRRPELEIVATSPNGIDVVERALEARPDVLFLDIKMPGQSGLEAAEELGERWDGDQPFPLVVFVTAYDEYAIRAFEQAAADYVLKPVNDVRKARLGGRIGCGGVHVFVGLQETAEILHAGTKLGKTSATNTVKTATKPVSARPEQWPGFPCARRGTPALPRAAALWRRRSRSGRSIPWGFRKSRTAYPTR